MDSINPDRTKIPASLGEFGEQLSICDILNPRQIEELNDKIESGKWPVGAKELASRLYHEKWLTEFQARKLLNKRAAELIIGRYLILDRLGAGAMGEVFKAEHQFMGRVVALKMIKQELMSERLVKRFEREMRLAARMNHPNVVRAYDADQIGNVYYIAMEYVAGKSLGELLKAGPLRVKDVVKYGAQAALGLDHAHQQGILHRDVKPSNILLSEDRKIKLLDLGLGMLIDPASGDPMLTQAGNVVGTYDYMSPEQVKGLSLDGRSDLYSLACTMYHLMTGHPPFRHEVPLKRMSMRIDTRPVPITEYLGNTPIPRRLIAIMDKMLAINPDDRFQTGQELHEVLTSLLPSPSGTRAPVVAAEPAPPAEPPPAPPQPLMPQPVETVVPEQPTWLSSHPRLAAGAGLLLWLASLAGAYYAGISR